METIDTLRAEHDGVLAVLGHLERAASAAERGAPVPKDIFTDVQEFFSIFVDRCHHGKEEATVFPRLLATSTGTGVARQLEAEHGTGRRLAAAYASAVREYSPGDAAAGRHLAETARAYDAFLREHIDRENTDLFPAIERELASQDRALAEEFERIEVEKIGPGTHERLHGMIDSLGPRIERWMT